MTAKNSAASVAAVLVLRLREGLEYDLYVKLLAADDFDRFIVWAVTRKEPVW